MDINVKPESRSVAIIFPKTAEPVGLTIQLRPSTSPEVKEVQRKMLNENLRNRGKVTAEKLEANRLDVLVAATQGWTWGKDSEGKDGSFGGEQLEATPENIRKVYKVEWIRSQVDEALADDAAFFRGVDGSTD